MDPKFNTSFIPKKPVVEAPIVATAPRHKDSKNIFSVLATLLFFVTLLACGGAYIYKNIVIKQIAQADSDINAARAAFETDKIQDLIDANSRLVATKQLLDNHVAVSGLVDLLQSLTVKKVRLTSLIYHNKDISTNMLPSVTLTMDSLTYNALAEQSDAFSKNDYIKNPLFSNFTLTDNGDITAKFFAGIDPTLTSYKTAVEALSTQTTQTPSPTTSTVPDTETSAAATTTTTNSLNQ